MKIINLIIWLCFHLLYKSIPIQCVPTAADDRDPSYWNQQAKQTIDATLKLQFNNKIARNVILFLGDGLSIPTLTAARIYKGQKKNQRGEEEYLEFEKFPHSALIKTYNVDRQVPDSAATATAFLSGVKANYETIGLNAHSKYNECSSVEQTKVKSIADWAQEAGKVAGVVTTTAITHATPAALYAHVPNRDWESDNFMTEKDAPCKDIARQLVEDMPGRELKVILGGGRQHFLLNKNETGKYGVRLDGQNLIEKWKSMDPDDKKSRKFVSTLGELNQINVKADGPVLGLFSDRHMSYESDRNKNSDGQPSITEMTLKAIEILNEYQKGYFLLVEGGRIDHAHHASLGRKALEETLAMEEAILAAIKKVNLDETLILVTADHAHVMTINGYPKRGNNILGIADISDVDNLPYTTIMYTTGPGFNYTDTGKRHNISLEDTTHLNYVQLAAVPSYDETHGGDDVAIYAQGPMAHLFHGLQEQNYIAHVMAYASCIGPYSDPKNCPRPTVASSINVNSQVELVIALFILVLTLNGMES